MLMGDYIETLKKTPYFDESDRPQRTYNKHRNCIKDKIPEIQKMLKASDYNVKDIAELTGVSVHSVYNIKNGVLHDVTEKRKLARLEQVAKVLRIHKPFTLHGEKIAKRCKGSSISTVRNLLNESDLFVCQSDSVTKCKYWALNSER
jgi:hypothetical protein